MPNSSLVSKPLREELRTYWSKNNALEFHAASVGSRSVVEWVCSFGHNFNCEVKKMATRLNFICEECKISNSIAVVFPELLKFYDEAKNGFSAAKAQVNRDYPIWWSFACGHSTKRTLKSFVKETTCFTCEPKIRKSVFEAYPRLKSLWSTLNEEDASQVSSWSREHYFWDCGKGHLLRRTIEQMKDSSKECKLCVVSAVSDCVLTVEYDELKNELSANALSSRSKKRVWWLCESGHSFKREVRDQVAVGRLCPECSRNGGSISTLEVSVREELVHLFPGEPVLFNFRGLAGVHEVDVYFPERGLAFDVNGEYWHSDAIARKNGWGSAGLKHERKIAACDALQVKLLYIWEDDWNSSKVDVLEDVDSFLKTGILAEKFTRVVSNRDL